MKDNNEFIKNYASFLSKLSGNELSIIAFISGYALAQGLTPEEQNSIGNLFEAVGQTLLCIGSQGQYLDSLKQRK
jgi:hypothetical protein